MPLLKRIKYLFQPRALVLMYHRIAELMVDPWQLAVSPQNFEQHLQVLQKNGNLISAGELATALHNKAVKPDTICITFDDGYGDNYRVAKPLLEKYQCPATFFIPTLYPGQDRQFWWDELETIFLHCPTLPRTLSLSTGGTKFEFDLGNDDVLSNDQIEQHKQWTWPAKPPNRRCELYHALWEQLKPLAYPHLQAVLSEIKEWASFPAPSATEDFPMTHVQLKELTVHPLIHLGMHTVSHAALASHSRQEQLAEITGSKQYLEGLCGRPIDTIAYPYGSHNDLTLSVAKELKLKAAFTTAEKVVTNFTHSYQIARFQVKNWNGAEFERWLQNWKRSPDFLA